MGLLAAGSAASEDDGLPDAVPYSVASIEMTDWEFEASAPLPGVPEPSGLCFDPERNSLFIVDDGAEDRPSGVYELDLHANVLASFPLGDDLEGICYCSADGMLYVADETAETVYVVDPDGLKLVREFQVSRFLDGQEQYAAGGNGFEGIEYVPWLPDANDGDFFVIVNQDDPQLLIRVNRSDADNAASDPVPISAVWPVAKINTGELHYDVEKRELWVVHSWMNVVEILTVPSMADLRWEVFPGAAQEAVTVDGEGRLWIGYDLGGIARYTRK